MRLSSSLTNRIFLACTLLATVSLGFAFAFVNAQVTGEVEAELRRDLSEAGTLVDQRRAIFTETFTTFTRLIADLPKLKARSRPATRPPCSRWPTSTANADRRRRARHALSPSGAVLARSGVETDALMQAARRRSRWTRAPPSMPHARGLLQVVSVPIMRRRRSDQLDRTPDGGVLPRRPARGAVQGGHRHRDRVRGRRPRAGVVAAGSERAPGSTR